MTFLEFILDNWQILSFLIIFIVIIILLIIKDRKDVVLKMIKVLVTEAEKEFGSGTGSLKLASVINILYPKLPKVIKLFVPQKLIVKWIESVLIVAKDEWLKNKALKRYIEGTTNISK